MRRSPARASCSSPVAISSPRQGSTWRGCVDIKTSRGKTFVVLDGGMHHHLAASGNLGQVIKRNFPIAVLTKLDRDRERGRRRRRPPLHAARRSRPRRPAPRGRGRRSRRDLPVRRLRAERQPGRVPEPSLPRRGAGTEGATRIIRRPASGPRYVSPRTRPDGLQRGGSGSAIAFPGACAAFAESRPPPRADRRGRSTAC